MEAIIKVATLLYQPGVSRLRLLLSEEHLFKTGYDVRLKQRVLLPFGWLWYCSVARALD